MSSVYRSLLYEGYPGSVLPRLRHDGKFRCNNEIKTSEPFALVHKTQAGDSGARYNRIASVSELPNLVSRCFV